VLIGNTSQSGVVSEVGGRGVAPLAFIRRLACVNSKMEPVQSGACLNFHTVPADGYAQHPYEPNAPPWVPSATGQADWAQMGDLPRVQALLDRLVSLHRLAPGARNLWLTEQGYATNAELTDMPWTEAQQGPLNAVSEYLAWRDPHVVSFSQFLLRDTRTRETLALRIRTGDPHAGLAGTWTTGLLREDLAPKPALWMFRAPVVARIVRAPPGVSTAGLASIVPASFSLLLDVWGRARPIRSPTMVEVEVADAPFGGFDPVGVVSTDSNGIFELRIGLPVGVQLGVRFRWLAPDGRWQTSPTTQPMAIPIPSG
jgi:hypothetical protein